MEYFYWWPDGSLKHQSLEYLGKTLSQDDARKLCEAHAQRIAVMRRRPVDWSLLERASYRSVMTGRATPEGYVPPPPRIDPFDAQPRPEPVRIATGMHLFVYLILGFAVVVMLAGLAGSCGGS